MTYVRGHWRRDGSYVRGHYRSSSRHTLRIPTSLMLVALLLLIGLLSR